MRKLVRRGLATTPGTDEAPRRRERSQEELESNAAKQAMKRRVAELWSKQPHGYTGHDLNFILKLNLSSCNLSDEDGIALASELSSTERRPLRVVDLRGNRFQDTALTALAGAFARGGAPCLTFLSLEYNACSDVGLKALTDALADGALARLEALYLGHNHFGDAGVAALAEVAEGGALKRLTALSLSGNAVGDVGIKALARVTSDEDILPALSELHLCETQVTGDGGIAALCDTLMPRTGGLPALRALFVDDALKTHPRLLEMHQARTGHGGVHACKVVGSF